MSRWIAVDWGTSTLRATLMQGEVVQDRREAGTGMNSLTQEMFEPTLLGLIDDWLAGPTPVLACGMVGARQGWAEARYAAVPCAPMGTGLTQVKTSDPRLDVRIVPGLKQLKPHADVMRGEETQIAGILATLPDFDGVACLPGTHTKWVHLSAGEVVSFRTVMTGELFATITGQTVLRHSLDGDGWDEGPFIDAVSDALSRPETLAARLFELRAADLLHGQTATMGRSVLSGLLIGAELAATRPWWLGRDVVITGSPRTTQAYDAALKSQGVAPRLLPADEMTLKGLATAKDLP
ncbi:2-keto-3-deoxy-galactonokinase [Jannaschia pagri]|uniref:2-keto-3-deoxy-galactonokinase n=1 Tax=Jannaschia pagri TaxID=2829797 RepID=A0ABQ4NKN9_9RHOB|nr:MULTISPECIES: 2-dehydro-3-deoxygalactonokinase [unclassified Jannaschia]GIT91155.1 2-keto-3-deoxy-galactonokinase [Jannaschia sp. AI_61]GIT94987.1 2-keto-3-deoxy-galactonokinase [Jannaschia sp. AI_62]